MSTAARSQPDLATSLRRRLHRAGPPGPSRARSGPDLRRRSPDAPAPPAPDLERPGAESRSSAAPSPPPPRRPAAAPTSAVAALVRSASAAAFLAPRVAQARCAAAIGLATEDPPRTTIGRRLPCLPQSRWDREEDAAATWAPRPRPRRPSSGGPASNARMGHGLARPTSSPACYLPCNLGRARVVSHPP
nr:predicted GPI-anchored protein 58 [Aegilops tauschii subsp. strangulata]